MHFITFLVLASLCFAGALQVGAIWAEALLVYAGLSFLFVGCAYLCRRPQWLLKASSGRMRPLAWFLYGPFFLVNGLLLHSQRRFSRELATAQIVPGLFLGRLLTGLEASLVAPQPVAVLDLVAEFSETMRFRTVPGYMFLPVLDGTPPSLQQLHQGVEHIREGLGKGPVYVHCALGHGRSATMVVAFLLAAGLAHSVEEAAAMVRSKRKGIALNPTQGKRLREFESLLTPADA